MTLTIAKPYRESILLLLQSKFRSGSVSDPGGAPVEGATISVGNLVSVIHFRAEVIPLVYHPVLFLLMQQNKGMSHPSRLQ